MPQTVQRGLPSVRTRPQTVQSAAHTWAVPSEPPGGTRTTLCAQRCPTAPGHQGQAGGGGPVTRPDKQTARPAPGQPLTGLLGNGGWPCPPGPQSGLGVPPELAGRGLSVAGQRPPCHASATRDGKDRAPAVWPRRDVAHVWPGAPCAGPGPLPGRGVPAPRGRCRPCTFSPCGGAPPAGPPPWALGCGARATRSGRDPAGCPPAGPQSWFSGPRGPSCPSPRVLTTPIPEVRGSRVLAAPPAAPTWKARARMLLAAGTSPASHLDLAPMSHSTSALGQWATALCSSASRDSLQDRAAVTRAPRAPRPRPPAQPGLQSPGL